MARRPEDWPWPSVYDYQRSRSCPSADGRPQTMKMREAPWSAAAPLPPWNPSRDGGSQRYRTPKCLRHSDFRSSLNCAPTAPSGLSIDRVLLPADVRTRIWKSRRGSQATETSAAPPIFHRVRSAAGTAVSLPNQFPLNREPRHSRVNSICARWPPGFRQPAGRATMEWDEFIQSQRRGAEHQE